MFNQFSLAQRKRIITTYYNNRRDLGKTSYVLRGAFKNSRLSAKTIKEIIRKYEATGSFSDLPQVHNRVGRCSENIAAVYKLLAENPNISRQQLIRQTGIPKSTLYRILTLDLNTELGGFAKEEARSAFDNKNAVLELLFKAFDKQQYYSIMDLVKITKKPTTYVRDILVEICDCEIAQTNKNMWHLKREYAYYTSDDDGASTQGSESQVVTSTDDCLVKIEKVWSLADE